jgi:hypothetical protein
VQIEGIKNADSENDALRKVGIGATQVQTEGEGSTDRKTIRPPSNAAL